MTATPITNLQLVNEKPNDGRTLLVSEVFGPTFQGEGPALGRRCAFIRLGACNLACTWCDTSYTWDWTGKNGIAYDPKTLVRMNTDEIILKLAAMPGGIPDLVVISGGEPMLQARHLKPLLEHLYRRATTVHVETNGTVIPPGVKLFPWELVQQYTVSLKVSSSGNPVWSALSDDAIRWYRGTGRAVWKFVATSMADLDEIEDIRARWGLWPIWVMPEGTTPEKVLQGMRYLADPVAERGWNLTTRAHVLIWGNERGR